MSDQQSKQIECLYIQMYNILFEYAKSALSNETLAEEAIQEVFRIACQKPAAVCESINPQGWMVLTIKHVISNMGRSQFVETRALAKYSSLNPDIASALPTQIEVELLYNDIADTEEFHMLKEMTIEGLSYPEMAQKRGITVEACRKRMQRAKEFLRTVVKL